VVCFALVAATAGAARAQSAGPEIHGFASEGAFVSTDNDYIGRSSRGTLELFEAGVNFSMEVVDRLRVGLQLYGRDIGQFRDLPPRLDWAFLDYHWQRWLGLRAGIIKMPWGLYNEYEDIDASRLAILLPQSVYQVRNRSALLAHTGFSLYGNAALGDAGELDYQAWIGSLEIPANALTLSGAALDDIDPKYVAGAQLFWHPPVEGLRVGGTFIRAVIDFHVTLDAANIAALIAAGLVPPGYDGALTISQEPDTWWILSVEYAHDDWLFAAEYARTYKHQVTSLPEVLPALDDDNERFYVLATRRLSRRFEVGGYYSHYYVDPGDRGGDDKMKFARESDAFQRDLAATVRLDLNDHWLWKLEAHFMDGTADLDAAQNPTPERYWGLFLLKTTVTF
jgi:hypothetical protein